MTQKLALTTLALVLLAGICWLVWPGDEAPTTPTLPGNEEPAALAPAVVRGTEGHRDELDRPVEGPGGRAVLGPDEGLAAALAGVTGRLLEADGTPVVGVDVTLLQVRASLLAPDIHSVLRGAARRFDPFLETARTDDGGRFTLHGARARSAVQALGIDLGGPRGGLWFKSPGLTPGETSALGDVVLGPTGELSGRVVDEAGAPLAGVRVRVAPPLEMGLQDLGLGSLRAGGRVLFARGNTQDVLELPPWFAAVEARFPLPTTRTGPDGRFRLAHVPLERRTMVLDAPGRVSRLEFVLLTTPGDARELGEMPLAEGARLRGRVVDAGGVPVAGAEVFVGEAPAWGFAALVAVGPTDAAGRFAATGIAEPRGARVAVRGTPGARWHVATVEEADAELEIVLPGAGATLVVDVRTFAEEPVGGAEFYAFPASETPPPWLFAHLPPDPLPATADPAVPGRYRIEGLGPGDYVLSATAPGFAANRREWTMGTEDAATTLVVLPAHDAEVLVLDDETGAPVAGAEVAVLQGGSSAFCWAAGSTDGAGRCRLRDVVDPEWVEGRRAVPREGRPGPGLFLRVEHPAHALGYAAFDPRESPTEIRLDRGGALRLRVSPARTSTGAAWGFLALPEGPMRRGPEALFPLLGESDGEGVVHLSHLPAGDYGYRLFRVPVGLLDLAAGDYEADKIAARGSFAIVAGETTELEREIDAPPPAPAPDGSTGSVTGRVLRAGVPARDLVVELTTQSWRGRQTHSTLPDATGAFRVDGVEVGVVQVSIGRQTLAPRGRTVSIPLYVGLHELANAEDGLHLEFDWATRRFEVQVRDAAGAPVASAFLWLAPVAGARVDLTTSLWTDHQGRASVETLVADRLRLTAWHEAKGTGVAELDLAGSAPSEPLLITLREPLPVAATLSFASPSDVPPRAAQLQLINPRRGDRVYLSDGAQHFPVNFVGATATLELRGLMPGPHRVLLRDGDRTWHASNVVISGEEGQSLRIAFE